MDLDNSLLAAFLIYSVLLLYMPVLILIAIFTGNSKEDDQEQFEEYHQYGDDSDDYTD